MKEGDLVVLDRNCHKSIEQGLMLTGARPVYMVPKRNRYGIIGPLDPSEMDPKTIRAKAQAGSLTKACTWGFTRCLTSPADSSGRYRA